jgi:hypothetical protein
MLSTGRVGVDDDDDDDDGMWMGVARRGGAVLVGEVFDGLVVAVLVARPGVVVDVAVADWAEVL